MVKSSSSCFKIITCGSDSIDQDDSQRIESKSSSDKRGWSFRKRSARHKVPSSNSAVVTESPSSTGNKESPELAADNINFDAQKKKNNDNTTVPEKLSVSQWMNETYPLIDTPNSNTPDEPIFSKKDDCKPDVLVSMESESKPLTTKLDASKSDRDREVEEASAISIQTAIRGYLARRSLLKTKNVVKLQAAVRGHLVRNQAVGSLRCVQAIIKLQALVRARHIRRSLEGLTIDEKGNENSGTKANRNYSATEKLLTNGFARQLMESTPKKKQINMRCDPLKPDSSWKWLERWMSVSSSDSAVHNRTASGSEFEERRERIENTDAEVEQIIPAEVGSDSTNLNSTNSKPAAPHGGEETMISYDTDNFVFQACRPISSTGNDMEQPWLDAEDSRHVSKPSSEIDTSPTRMLTTAAPAKVSSSISNEPEADCVQPKRSMKRVATEQPETEGKKQAFGSRKACNPAFVAVQSKFEGLSSTATSSRSISSTSQDVGVASKLESLSSPTVSVTKAYAPSLTENSTSHEPRMQVEGSECGSVLSVTSTLDSPDRSEVGMQSMDKATSDLNAKTDNPSEVGDLDIERFSSSSTSVSFQPENSEDINIGSISVISPTDSNQIAQQPERSASNVQIQLDAITDQQQYRSPEGSPRSLVTVPESHGTPSSQVSVNAKRSKSDRAGPNQNRKFHSAGRSPSSVNHDSGARSSTDPLTKDSKSGKRRSSFGSSRSDHVDQEARDSSCSSSMPSYMQATESARAKALASISPRASPEVQDKDVYVKKRHSLPGTNGKQGSPRMQRSMSQVQPPKGNGAQSPHEKKWVR